jgi:hypothetical protein
MNKATRAVLIISGALWGFLGVIGSQSCSFGGPGCQIISFSDPVSLLFSPTILTNWMLMTFVFDKVKVGGLLACILFPVAVFGNSLVWMIPVIVAEKIHKNKTLGGQCKKIPSPPQ